MLNRVVNRKKPAPAAPPPHDPWKLRRERHWRLLYRGKDKKLHFHGQQPDEFVRMVVRKHKWFLVQPALPFIGSIALFLLVTAGALRLPQLGVLWVVVDGAAIMLMIVTGVWFLWRDFIVWWFNVDIITNKRLIRWSGFLSPSRKEYPTEKIQQIAVDARETLGEILLGYGDLHLYIVGGEIDMKQIPHPKEVRDEIEGITDDIKANKKPDPKPPVPADPEIAKVLADLGKQKEKPKPPDPDSKYPPLHKDRRIGPRRTFGGPLRIVCDVRYAYGESTVMYIQHSWFVLFQRMVLPVLALLLVLPLTVYVPSTSMLPRSFDTMWWGFFALVIVGLLVYLAIVYINYADDVYILTNRRIIDIERKLMFLYEDRMTVDYKNIRDIRVILPNALLTLLDIGNVYIETPGNSPDVVFRMVRHPLSIQDKINQIKGLKDQADKIEAENNRKKELHMWFGTVLTTQEQEQSQKTPTTSKGAPNVCKMDLFEAMEKADEQGLNIVVVGEEPVTSEYGQVVHQNPPPGTLIEVGGELQVWLGRRVTPADII
ncbi:MAG TPA: PASTA domain-containing protein [Ktedonobacteraceae bacterium]|nr:PASTA domain-containing protein [Ktedonobacteraceae bacterium]